MKSFAIFAAVMAVASASYMPNVARQATQIADGQIQAPTPVTQIADGQVQAPTPVTQIADGQIQAPAPVTQIADGQVQAPAPVTQIADGQIQAPTPGPAYTPPAPVYTGAAAMPIAGSFGLFAAGAAAVAMF